MNFRQHFYKRLQLLSERDAVEFPSDMLPVDYKPAAVLLCFWPAGEEGVEVVMTKRTHNVSSHQGQVSFPGGRVDETDLSHEAAALRETWEELGIEPRLVRVMGRLDDAWSRYGHHVIPYVGWLDKPPHLKPNPDEVAEVLIADMETIMQPSAERNHKFVLPTAGDKPHMAKAFEWEGGYVWGLTADLLLELILWIREEPSARGKLRMERMLEFGV